MEESDRAHIDTRFAAIIRELDQRFADVGRQLNLLAAGIERTDRSAVTHEEFNRFVDSYTIAHRDLTDAVSGLSVSQGGYISVAAFDAYATRQDVERAADRRARAGTAVAAAVAVLIAVATIIAMIALAP